ncbi:hypothetical protein [Spirillospora sp. NPDC048823]|uniref:hypothetical protein n=1 Tax=unclassified Spirillospora TaxID=2642701 RepID=UPI00371DE199
MAPPDDAESDDLVLPKRNRGAALANAPAGPPAARDRLPRDTGSRFAAFRRSAAGHPPVSAPGPEDTGTERTATRETATRETATGETGPGDTG